jgi:hypothetical protein
VDEVAAECFSEKLATKVRLPAVLKEEKVTCVISWKTELFNCQICRHEDEI